MTALSLRRRVHVRFPTAMPSSRSHVPYQDREGHRSLPSDSVGQNDIELKDSVVCGCFIRVRASPHRHLSPSANANKAQLQLQLCMNTVTYNVVFWCQAPTNVDLMSFVRCNVSRFGSSDFVSSLRGL